MEQGRGPGAIAGLIHRLEYRVRRSYGFLLATGDVVRVMRVAAVHVSSAGTVLIDLLLDHAGVPGGVDTAWQRTYGKVDASPL